MSGGDERRIRHERLKHLYGKLVDLIVNGEKSISDRTSIFLVFNSFMFAGTYQLLSRVGSDLSFFTLKIVVPLFGILICYFQVSLVLSLLDALRFYRKKTIAIEHDEDFWYPEKREGADAGLAVFDEKTKAEISRYMKGIAGSKNPINAIFSRALDKLGIEAYFVYSSEIFGIYMPVLLSFLWLIILAFVLVTDRENIATLLSLAGL